MAQSLIDDPDFRTGVGYAKALAGLAGVRELTPEVVLLGLARVRAARGGLAAAAPLLADLQGQLAAIADALGIDPAAPVTPVAPETKLPTSAALRETLAGAADLPDLVGRLFERTEKNPAANLALLRADEAFRACLAHAARLGREQGRAEVDRELLVAGAWHALATGHLDRRPSLVLHLRAYGNQIATLLAERGWPAEPLATDAPAADLPLAPDVLESAAEADCAGDPFLGVLNSGLAAALGIRLRLQVAYHEAGHAVVSLVLRPRVRIREIVVSSSCDLKGHVAYDRGSLALLDPTNCRDTLDDVCVSLAGRAAEQRRFGDDSADAGARRDLERGTARAWRAITQWGLDPGFGLVSLTGLSAAGAGSSGWLHEVAQRRLRRLLAEAMTRTKQLVAEHWAAIEAVACALAAGGRLTEDEMLALLPTGTGIMDAACRPVADHLPLPDKHAKGTRETVRRQRRRVVRVGSPSGQEVAA